MSSSTVKRGDPSVSIERPGAADRAAILAVMRHANMHHVPSREMEELDLSCFFVARVDGRIVAAAGWKVVEPGRGKTTLLAVVPQYERRGIGEALQRARLTAMHKLGVHTVTNADRPATIAWYKAHFGYREVATLPKLHEFGDPAVDHWTTLETDLDAYMADRAGDDSVPRG